MIEARCLTIEYTVLKVVTPDSRWLRSGRNRVIVAYVVLRRE